MLSKVIAKNVGDGLFDTLYILFLQLMLVKLILAACTECGRPTLSSCRVWQWLRLVFFITWLIKALFIKKLSCVGYSVC